MPRPEKVKAVQDIKERMEEAQAFFLTEFRGLSVGDLQRLRRSLSDAGADYKVVKMTLARRAADELGFEGVGDHLVGPTALTFARSDAVAAAKALDDYAKDNEALVVKLGVLAGTVLPPEEVTKLAKIEPREVLLAKIAGAAKAPLYQLAGMMASFSRNTATMMSQLLEKKQAGEFVREVAAAEPAAAAEPEPEPIAEPEPEPELEPTAEPEAAAATPAAGVEPKPAVESDVPTDDTDETAATAEEE